MIRRICKGKCNERDDVSGHSKCRPVDVSFKWCVGEWEDAVIIRVLFCADLVALSAAVVRWHHSTGPRSAGGANSLHRSRTTYR